MTKLRKFIPFVAAGVILALLIAHQSGLFVTGAVKPGTTEPSQTEERGEPLKLAETTIPVIYKAVGTVHSRDEVELSPRITARIIQLNARSGDRVEKDQLLLQLDDSDLRAVLNQAKERFNEAEAAIRSAEQAVKKAEAAYILAKSNLERDRGMVEKKAISQKSYEESVSAFDQASSALNQAEREKERAVATLSMARASINEAKARLSFASIRGPMDGIVADQLADVGDLASPGQILMTVFDPERLMMYTPIRESLVASVKTGQSVNVDIDALDRSMSGVVKEIVPSVTPASRTFLIKICLDDVKGVMPGMFGTLRLPVGSEKALLIPTPAIRRVGQLKYVQKRTDAGVLSILIRSVPRKDGTERVVAGLGVGDVILVPPSVEPSSGTSDR